MCKENNSVLTFKPTDLRVFVDHYVVRSQEAVSPAVNYDGCEDGVLTRFRAIGERPTRELRAMWCLIKKWNEDLAECLKFVNMDFRGEQLDIRTIGQEVAFMRSLILQHIKIEQWLVIMQRTSFRRETPPKVVVERLKISELAETEDEQAVILTSPKDRDKFMFTMAMEQLQNVPSSLFRPVKPRGTDPFLAFEVTFKGENVMGEAGPYRQFFADISSELQANPLDKKKRNLGIFIPSINNSSKFGEEQGRFIPNPAAKSSYQLQMFEFLGLLMACSVRTSTHFSMDLPSLFWKKITHEKVGLEELDEIDKRATDLLRIIEGCPSKEVFDQEIGKSLYFVTALSDGSNVELKKNGARLKVSYAERTEYIRRTIEARLNESHAQIQAVREGMAKLVPSPWLNIISGTDLEVMVCGKPTVNIELLRKHTKYAGGLNDKSPRILFFWAVMDELSKQEQLRLIKFCWGQERLPATS